MTDKDKTLPNKIWPFVWHFLRGYKSLTIFYFTLAAVAGFWGPLNSLLLKRVINLLPTVTDGHISILIVPATLIVVNYLVIYNLSWRGIERIQAKFTPVILNCIIGESMDHVLGKSAQFYQQTLSGKTLKEITNLAHLVDLLIRTGAYFPRYFSALLTATIASYFANPIFFFILVVWLILFSLLRIFMARKLRILTTSQGLSESMSVGELVDCLYNHNNIRIFSRRSFENSRMASYLEKVKKDYQATALYALRMYSIQGWLFTILIAFSCYFLVYLYSKNLVTIGDFALILGLTIDTGHTAWFAVKAADPLNRALSIGQQSLTSLMIPFEIHDKPDAVALKCNRGQITFDNVKFHYKETEPLFQNISIKIKASSKVGLVGYSGAGKSTFINLLLRLYDITKGAILIDGQDVRDVTQDSLHANIAMIPQDPSLFNRSLMDNIRYGRIEATDEEVISAAKKAHAHEFIEKLSQGYDSLAGEHGAQLSGGQRQRIAIARAILKNAPILILDEASSQLDSFTESLIQESLWQLIQNKTTLIIAHRLSTLLHMDRILVFDQGVIVEDGTPTELLSLNGLYRKLWDSQVGGFLLSKKSNEG
ncbi:MAG: ABC transporter ATP-binding protein [Chlamydiae bacterium]|nr:ABC transporter ATP-binding protein [Chlamydiota bacterium]